MTRTGGSFGVVGVTFATSNGTATAPGDYTAVTQTVGFANGDTAPKTISIPIINDTTAETPANETVNLTLSNPTGGATLGSPNSAVLTITDDDVAPGALQFSASTYSVAENAGTGTAVVTVTRTGGSFGVVGVTFATSNGTATAPGDYTAVTQTVGFANGDTAPKTISIPIINDTTAETPANETVNLTLSNPTGGATLGSPNSAVLTITDDDVAPGTLQFSASTYSVAENSGNAAVTVTRTGGSAGAVSVTFATGTGGTATASVDYTAVNQTVLFVNGDTTNKTVNIPILNDTTAEPDETVNLTLSNPIGATLGTRSTAVLTIRANKK